MIVAIEGGDQAGKQTQSVKLRDTLMEMGKKVALFHFPDYNTAIGEEIKRRLNFKDSAIKETIHPKVIHCLLAANRWEKYYEINRATKDNDVVIMDRYYHSNIVYGKVSGIDESWLENLEKGIPKPDLVILLDMCPAESFQRKKAHRDKFEADKDFLQEIFKAYRSASNDRMGRGERWTTIDASESIQAVHKKILMHVTEGLDSHG